jgi:hypothetical protein
MCALHAEVRRPPLAARVKEGREDAALRVKRAEVGLFVRVAVWTGKSQVVWFGRAIMLLADDVLDLEGEEGGLLGIEAILAAPAGALCDQARSAAGT